MLPMPSKDPESLYPWSELADGKLPRTYSLAAEALPMPYRSLLAHQRDMTSTLESFHGQKVELKVLQSRRQEWTYLRRVLLVGVDDGRAVELGAIQIDLSIFSPKARQVIADGRRPLGAILADFSIDYRCSPQGFFQLWPDQSIARDLDLELDQENPAPLFGRRNLLIDHQGQTLAEVVEILPPTLQREADSSINP
jgi:chorismate-pyruvate lyase